MAETVAIPTVAQVYYPPTVRALQPESQATVINHQPVTISRWIPRLTGTRLLCIGIRFTGGGCGNHFAHVGQVKGCGSAYALSRPTVVVCLPTRPHIAGHPRNGLG